MPGPWHLHSLPGPLMGLIKGVSSPPGVHSLALKINKEDAEHRAGWQPVQRARTGPVRTLARPSSPIIASVFFWALLPLLLLMGPLHPDHPRRETAAAHDETQRGE